MSIELDEDSASVMISWTLEWHGLTRAAMRQATEHYFHGCADIAMARSPLQALDALHQIQVRLLSHSAHVFAETIMLWRRQNTDLLVTPTKHQLEPDRTRVDLRLREWKPTDEEVR